MSLSTEHFSVRQMVRKAAVALVCLIVPVLHGAENNFNQFQNTPLYFEAHQPSGFLARGAECNVWITPHEAVLVLARFDGGMTLRSDERKPLQTKSIRLEFLGANKESRMSGIGELPGKANYFIGNDPAQWMTGVPLFSKVRVAEIYAGVSLVYYCGQEQLEYDFHLQPGVSPETILFRVTGADEVKVDGQGNLILKSGGDEVRQHTPFIYQMAGGRQNKIDGGYRIADARTVGFWVGQHDETLPLVIDPILSFATFLGGTKRDTGWGIGLDGSGNIYVAGETISAGIATPGAYKTNYSGSYHAAYGDAFVAKYSSTTSNLLYLTYLGGRGDDGALAIAVDAAGNAFLTGYTDSTNFPLVKPITNSIPSQNRIHGQNHNPSRAFPVEAFVTEIGPFGTNLVYSTYLGGDGVDEGYKIALDNSGNAYVTGFTQSRNFPVVPTNGIGVIKTNFGGVNDVFVTKVSFDGARTWIAYSTYLGGSSDERGQALAVDSTGAAYVAGYTASKDFMITNAIQTNQHGAFNAFISKLAPDGASLAYSTYFGGSNTDVALGIALDASANVYVTGYTTSTNIPVTTITNLQSRVGATNRLADVFVLKLDATGSNVIYYARFGGSLVDMGQDIAVDSAGNACIVGMTSSANFPTTNTFGVLRTNNSSVRIKKKGGTNDVFISKLNTNGFLLSAYFGGSQDEAAYAVKTDPAGNIYFIGQTTSPDFPATNAIQPGIGGGSKTKFSDVFIAKILGDPPLNITASGTNVIVTWDGFTPELVLEQSANPLLSSGWKPAGQSTPSNYLEHVTVPMTNSTGFFQLRGP